ncbi:hypothetical protein BASA81_012894 [Batrachochytrium salamandrivorans]|nr:hypothetical protein BASA81_012894 [Batrachochytrium salamandrivorans]
MPSRLQFPDLPISPFVDDLFLIEPDASSSLDLFADSHGTDAEGGEGRERRSDDSGELLLKSRNVLASQFLASIRKRSRKSAKSLASNNTTGERKREEEENPPPHAFLTVATITIQLSMLRQLSQQEHTLELAVATCDGLLQMLAPMPIRSLREMTQWERKAMMQISSVMEDLAKSSPRLGDSVKSLLLSFAIHRASLCSILQVLETILPSQSTFVCASETAQLIRRMRTMQSRFLLEVDWSVFERRFPVRCRLSRPTKQQVFIAPNPDSSALYLSTGAGLLLKIGSGDARVLGSCKQFVPGRVYAEAHTEGGGFVFTMQSRLFVVYRDLGSSVLRVEERDCDTLQLLTPIVSQDLIFKDLELVDQESLSVLSGEDDDKEGATVSWASPCGSWQRAKPSYFEVTVQDCGNGGTLCVGWHSPTFNSADNLRVGGGGDAACWGVDVLSQEVFYGGTRRSLAVWKLPKFGMGDVLGCAMQVHGQAALVSFSHNGVWWNDVFRLDEHEGQSRPLVSYSCAEQTAPRMNFGGDEFKFAPPSPFAAQCLAMESVGARLSGSLPLLACNGHTLFAVTATTASSFTVESFVLADGATNSLVLKEIHTYVGGPIIPSPELMIANVCGDLLLLCKEGKQQYALRDGKVVVLQTTTSPDTLDAVAFDRQLNVVWGWNVQENAIVAYGNKALGGCLPATSMADNGLFDACESIAASLAKLALPFASAQVPLNISHTHCAICNNPGLRECHFRDLFVDPFDSHTFSSFAAVLDFVLGQDIGSFPSLLLLLESMLVLLQVNLHVACCQVGAAAPSSPFPPTAEWTESLKRSLVKSAALGLPAIACWAERCLVEAIPLFWPSLQDKLALISAWDNAVVLDRVLGALNQQLLTMGSFPAHRQFLDDLVIARLLRVQTGPLGHSASGVLVGLVACAFNHLTELDNMHPLSLSSAALSASSLLSPSSLLIVEEETKEDTGALSPYEDVFGILLQLAEHCLATKFATPVAKRVLPLMLVCVDNLLGDAATSAHAVKSMLQTNMYSTLCALAKGIVQDLKPLAAPLAATFTFAKMEAMSSTLDSRMFNPDADGTLRLSVHVPFASQMSIAFQTKVDLQPDEVITFKPSSVGGNQIVLSNDALPGSGGRPPLVFVNNDAFECTHANKDSKFAFRVIANRLVQCKSKDRDWSFHVFDAAKRLLNTLVLATTGSGAFGLTGKEQALIRWIQNPLFSGGLKSSEEDLLASAATTPKTMKKLGSRSSLVFQSLQEDADKMVGELLRFSPSTTSPHSAPSLANCLVLGMRQPSNRVPFDSGRLTQPAVCAVVAALIRTNGLEAEAVAFARVVADLGAAQAPLRLRAMWSAAQLVRAWCDSLIVNGRVERHFEACGVANASSSSSSLSSSLSSLPVAAAVVAAPAAKQEDDEEKEESVDGLVVDDEEGEDDDEREEREYAKLCALVQARCELISQVLSPPLFLQKQQRARPREQAKARWHYLREFYCPKTSRLLASDAMTCVLRGVLAWTKAMAARPPTLAAPLGHRKSSLLVNDDVLLRSRSFSSPGLVEIHTSRKASLSSFTDSAPSSAALGGGNVGMVSPLMRSNRLGSFLSPWGGGGPRIQSWIVAKDTSPMMPLSATSSSSGNLPTPLTRKASIIIDSGARPNARVEGGLRRAPADEGLDLAQMEHEQTMSESVMNFVQSATVLRKRDVTAALRSRNERAQARAQGLLVAVTIAQETDFRSRAARELFESVLCATAQALSSDSTMENHFLTDLGGCSLAWRDRVSQMFFVLLRVVCQHAARVAKNQWFLPQAKAVEHLACLLGCMQLDYVESDYSLLYRAQMFEALHASLRLPVEQRELAGASKAFQLFESLFRRCVIDHQQIGGGGGVNGTEQQSVVVIVGTIWQQQLMDVLVSEIGSFWGAHYDEEDLEFSDSEEEDEAKPLVRFTQKEILLCHRQSQLQSCRIVPPVAAPSGFSVQFVLRRQGTVLPGVLLSVCGDEALLQVCVDKQANLFVRVNGVLLKCTTTATAKSRRWLKVCLTVAEDGVLHLFCSSEEHVSHHSRPVQEQFLPGMLLVGSNHFGLPSCQGLVVCDLALHSSKPCTEKEFFGNDPTTMPKEDSFVRAAAAVVVEEEESELLFPPPPEHAAILSVLDLANLALKRSHSSIALARLSTPDLLSTLLQLLLDSRCPLPVRVSTARVLKRVLAELPPSANTLEQLCRCVSFAMPPTKHAVKVLIPDPTASSTMAQVAIDLIYFLCDANQDWSDLVANWAAAKIGGLVLSPGTGKLQFPSDDELKDVFCAISLCGGRMDFLRLGGKALVNKDELVHIVSQCPSSDWRFAEVDITQHCTVTPTTTTAEGLGGVIVRLPSSMALTRIEICNEPPNQHDSMRHAKVWFGKSESLLSTASPREIQVDPTAPVFELSFGLQAAGGGNDDYHRSRCSSPIRYVRIDVETVWGGSSTRCQIKQLRLFGYDTTAAAKATTATGGDRFLCRPVAPVAEADEAEGDKDVGPPLAYSANELLPRSRAVPKSIIERLVLGHQAMASFERLLFALHEYISSPAREQGKHRVVVLGLFTRLLKAVCAAVPMLAQLGVFVSSELALFLGTLAKTQNAKLSPVPASGKFQRNGVPEHWNMRFLAKAGEDVVRFEPVRSVGAFWPHRVALVDPTSGFGGSLGVHSWTFTLEQDGVTRGDESVLFGLCHSNLQGLGEDGGLDVLQPSSRFRLLRAFDGSAIGEAPPSPMLCVRVGDSLRCEWDVGAGTLGMAVNNRPLVCVFANLQGESWVPCVATYAERGAEVVVSLSHIRCTPPSPKRRLLAECQSIGLVQVEALAQAALQQMMQRSDEEVSAPTRSLTFRLGEEEETEEGESFGEGEEAETEDSDDEVAPSSRWSKPTSSSLAASAAAPVLPMSLHNPALCGVEERAVHVAAQPSSPPTSLHKPQAGTLSSSYTPPAMSSAERYVALLWELTARLATEGFDSVVKHWPASGAKLDSKRWIEVEETVSSLYRVHLHHSGGGGAHKTELELLNAVDVGEFLALAAKRIVRLGNRVSETKQLLKRPPATTTTVAPSASKE